MHPKVRRIFDLSRTRAYCRPSPLVLVNGLAEQAESWFPNRGVWARHFDLKVPEILVYDGQALHDHIDAGREVTVDYITDRLSRYLDDFVQRPPYYLVGSSLGGQVVVNYAVRQPQNVSKLVLICPSGFHGDENLPAMEGVRRSRYDSLVQSVFHRAYFASDELVAVIEQKFQDRRWKKGVLRTLRGTVGHSVAHLLNRVEAPTLAVWGEKDRVLSSVAGSVLAAEQIPGIQQVVIPNCGHAPQIEKARVVNPLVLRFLNDDLKTVPPATDPARFLRKSVGHQPSVASRTKSHPEQPVETHDRPTETAVANR